MIVACIVNTETGVIAESVEHNKEKLSLRLKCRDYYNKQQADDRLFITVEFSGMFSYSHTIEQMRKKGLGKEQLAPLVKTYSIFRLDQLENTSLPSAYTRLQEAQDSDAGDYQDAKDEAINDAEYHLQGVKHQISLLKAEMAKQ